MESILMTLFDFQTFSPDKELATLIEGTERRYGASPANSQRLHGAALSDDVLELVSAAGEAEIRPDKNKDKFGE